MTCSGRSALGARFLGVDLDELVDAVHEGVRDALAHRQLAPARVDLALLAGLALVAGRRIDHAVGGVGTAVEDHVLAEFSEFGFNVVVER